MDMADYDSKGSTIIIVLLVLLVLMILGITLLNINLAHTQILTSDKRYQAAYYYAEAGLMQETEMLCYNMELLYGDPSIGSREHFIFRLLETPIVTPEFEDYMGERIRISITRQRNSVIGGKDEVVLLSTCKIGKISRSVKAVIHMLWVDPMDPDFLLDHSNFSIVEWGET